MSKNFPQRPVRLRYEGVFDFKAFYKQIVSFWTSRNYTFYEKRWSEKEATPAGREIKFELEAEREVSQMARYYHVIKILALDAHEVDITQDGIIKRKMHMRFVLSCQARLEWDWQNIGKNHNRIQELFDKYILKRERILVHEDYLLKESQEFIDSIKEFLRMEESRIDKKVDEFG